MKECGNIPDCWNPSYRECNSSLPGCIVSLGTVYQHYRCTSYADCINQLSSLSTESLQSTALRSHYPSGSPCHTVRGYGAHVPADTRVYTPLFIKHNQKTRAKGRLPCSVSYYKSLDCLSGDQGTERVSGLFTKSCDTLTSRGRRILRVLSRSEELIFKSCEGRNSERVAHSVTGLDEWSGHRHRHVWFSDSQTKLVDMASAPTSPKGKSNPPKLKSSTLPPGTNLKQDSKPSKKSRNVILTNLFKLLTPKNKRNPCTKKNKHFNSPEEQGGERENIGSELTENSDPNNLFLDSVDIRKNGNADYRFIL